MKPPAHAPATGLPDTPPRRAIGTTSPDIIWPALRGGG